ncbi:GntR family transcriptional regulator [Paenibacillus sp. CAA11]|uniref:GntR family transcriptional regulator n=1 Tax=Paenibacillus sp. CAA11 TaxID=1532905 RepID=UPI00131F0488|nr:GntR family transcriptional regulator [Paenibacillus sp. CAA11]
MQQKMSRDAGKLSEQMKEHILQIIQEDGLKPHDPLPSEGELAERFGVSRMTSKMALQALQKEGIVYRIPRRGTFLAEQAEMHFASGNFSTNHRTKSRYIALIVPGIDEFVGRMIKEIEHAGRSKGLSFIIKVADHFNEESALLEELSVRRDISAILLFPVDRTICGESLLKLKLNRYPIIILDREFHEVEFDGVSHDHYEGAYKATEYLLDQGHEGIGFITEEINKATSREQRYQGYLDACISRQARIGENRILHLGSRSAEEMRGEDTEQKMKAWLKERHDITAVFCMNDDLALRMLKAAQQLGLSVPEDLSIVGFSGHRMLEYAPIQLTTVQQPMKPFGEAAVQLLCDRLANPEQAPRNIKVPTELARRDSVAHKGSYK